MKKVKLNRPRGIDIYYDGQENYSVSFALLEKTGQRTFKQLSHSTQCREGLTSNLLKTVDEVRTKRFYILATLSKMAKYSRPIDCWYTSVKRYFSNNHLLKAAMIKRATLAKSTIREMEEFLGTSPSATVFSTNHVNQFVFSLNKDWSYPAMLSLAGLLIRMAILYTIGRPNRKSVSLKSIFGKTPKYMKKLLEGMGITEIETQECISHSPLWKIRKFYKDGLPRQKRGSHYHGYGIADCCYLSNK